MRLISILLLVLLLSTAMAHIENPDVLHAGFGIDFYRGWGLALNMAILVGALVVYEWKGDTPLGGTFLSAGVLTSFFLSTSKFLPFDDLVLVALLVGVVVASFAFHYQHRLKAITSGR